MLTLRSFEALGLDSEEGNVGCLVRTDLPPPPGLGSLLEALGGAGPAQGRAERAAARGKVLIALGRPREARALLEPLAGRACRYPARTWLGQALLLSGLFAEARAALDLAVASEPEHAWAYFFRAAAKLALQDRAGAARDAESFRAKGGGACALALSALAEAGRRRWRPAARLLERAAASSPAQVWPLILAAMVHRAASDLPAAKEALARAVALRPSAWLHAELAAAHEKLGVLPEAIAQAAEAARLCPCAEHHALKARLHGCWREGAAAVAEYGLALALSPGDVGLLFDRSKASSAAGRLPEALADARAAARARPRDYNLACWEIQLLSVTGQRPRALRLIASLLERGAADPLLKAHAYFCRAYDSLRAKDRRAALRDLDRCLALCQGHPLRRKAAFYRVLAGLPAAGKPAAGKPGLSLIGLGVDPPYTATAAAVAAIGRCDVVFNNVMGDEMFEFLRPFCADCRPVAYHQDNDEAALAAEMLAEARPGRTVGFVTRGSAIVQGPLGALLLRRCREEGLSWDCLAAVSSSELLMARFGDPRRQAPGQATVDSRALGGPLSDPVLPLTLFLNMSDAPDQYPALCRRLAKRYGDAHACLVLDHVIGQQPLRVTMARLPGLRARLSHSAIFFIPGKKS